MAIDPDNQMLKFDPNPLTLMSRLSEIAIFMLVLGVIHKIHSPVRMCNTVPWLGGWGPWHNKCVWF